jgi:transposase-like protein
MAEWKERRAGDVTPEFRAAAVALVFESGKPVTVVAAELGIDHRTLWSWVDNARLKVIDPAGELPVEARRRIRELEQQNARLRRDLEFEKKAGAFFRELDRDENGSL